MKCQFCDQEARVFITQTVNGETHQLSLCKKCAEDRGLLEDGAFGLEALLLGGKANELLSQFAGQWQVVPLRNELKCDQCGFRMEDLLRISRAGCPNCYRAFRGQLTDIIRDNQRGSLQHRGKTPESALKRLEKESVLDALKVKLNWAIEEENYEKAAVLRDEIQKVEGRLENS